MTGRCPSELDLEEYLASPATSTCRRHIVGCGHCQAELHRMVGEGEEFERSVHPSTAEAIRRAIEE